MVEEVAKLELKAFRGLHYRFVFVDLIDFRFASELF